MPFFQYRKAFLRYYYSMVAADTDNPTLDRDRGSETGGNFRREAADEGGSDALFFGGAFLVLAVVILGIGALAGGCAARARLSLWRGRRRHLLPSSRSGCAL